MYETAIIWEWLSFTVRWLHVITAIAWVGSSFYFIALDLGLRRHAKLPKGAHGEEWQVHGGGFYHIQKYLVAPAQMPEHLTWFKWESYATWLSGFAMLAVLYYASAELYLIDPSVMALAPWQAIAISVASIALGWLIYDFLCKSPLGENNNFLMVLLFFVLSAMAWGYTQIFTGRAAFIHLGAFTATIMSANVFFIIIPNQKIVVADLIAGRVPDAKYGKIAKQRSTHNNYLTLPVIFLMLSNHYPLAFATEFNWVIAMLVFLMGVTIRHYFNSKHARTGNPSWTWLATAILFILIMWLSTVPKALTGKAEAALPGAFEKRFVSTAGFDEVRDLIESRCSMCHAAEPAWQGMISPPKGVVLENDRQIALHAKDIYLQAARSNAMPPRGVMAYGIELSGNERAQLAHWYEAATAR